MFFRLWGFSGMGPDHHHLILKDEIEDLHVARDESAVNPVGGFNSLRPVVGFGQWNFDRQIGHLLVHAVDADDESE